MQAVAANTATFGYVDVPTMIKAAAKGAPVKAIGVALQLSPMSVMGFADKNIRDAEGHRGQDRRSHAGRFDVADLAAIPQEDRPQAKPNSRPSPATPRPSSTPS